jgi:glycosyltransferase involved in cell wall biosynthesis
MPAGYLRPRAAGDGAPIALVLPNLRVGGVQTVALELAGALRDAGRAVDLVVASGEGRLIERAPPGVGVYSLAAPRLRHAVVPLWRYVRERRPDAMVVSMWPLTTLAVPVARIAGFRGPLLLVEHSVLSLSPAGRGARGLALRAGLRLVNRHADALVGVSDGVCDDLRELGAPGDRIVRLHNPVRLEPRSGTDDVPAPAPWLARPKRLRLLAIGRLKPAKDYPTMLEAMAVLRERGVDVGLLVLGDGPDRAALEALRDRFGLADHVHFTGDADDPLAYCRHAGLLLFSSRWEGFGNVIVEALSQGLPVVATDCRSGPAEVLEGGRLGALVPVGDAKAFADAVEAALRHEHDPAPLRARAADFSPRAVAARYLELIERCRT